jgi:hypothetical protein
MVVAEGRKKRMVPLDPGGCDYGHLYVRQQDIKRKPKDGHSLLVYWHIILRTTASSHPTFVSVFQHPALSHPSKQPF